MTSGVFDLAMVSALKGTFVNTTADSTHVYCILGSVQPTQTTSQTYADVKNGGGNASEISVVNGYALGGSGIAMAIPTMTSHVTGLKTTSATVFTTTGTLAAQWAIPQYAASSSTTTTNPLYCFLDMGAQSVTNGTLTLTWAAAGIFTLTVAAAT